MKMIVFRPLYIHNQVFHLAKGHVEWQILSEYVQIDDAEGPRHHKGFLQTAATRLINNN